MACPMRPPGGLPAREAAASERQPPKLDTWPRTLRAAAILANQFGTRCDRLLLVHDNLGGAGLGWSSNYWSIALAAAVQAGRVLHAVPSPSSANSSLATRWCDRPPFTLECYFLRWNDCEGTPSSDEVPVIKRIGHRATWGVEGLASHHFTSQNFMHLPLSSFTAPRWPSLHRKRPRAATTATARGNAKAGMSQAESDVAAGGAANASLLENETFAMLRSESLRFLFRPRAWVAQIGECVLARAPGRAHLGVFVRDSAEKRAELSAHGHGWPKEATYAPLALAVATSLLPPPHIVVLGTSSQAAYNRFLTFDHAEGRSTVLRRARASDGQSSGRSSSGGDGGSSSSSSRSSSRSGGGGTGGSRSKMRVLATENERSDHDGWVRGGSHPGSHHHMGASTLSSSTSEGATPGATRTAEGVIASVNLYLASRAAYFLSLSSSAWTYLVADLMEGSRAEPVLYLCCRCGPQDHYVMTPAIGEQDAMRLVNGTEKRKTNVVLLRASARSARTINHPISRPGMTPEMFINLSDVRGLCTQGPLLELSSGGVIPVGLS